MGCHTWFYRKLEPQPTYNEIKVNVLKQLNESILFYKNIIDGNSMYEKITGFYSELTPQLCDKSILVLERQIRMIEKDLCKTAQYNRYKQNSSLEIVNVDGMLFVGDTGYHDLFRKYGYPEDRLFSLEETMDYIERYKDEIVLYDNTLERLNEFWKLFPGGMIEFG